MFLTHHFVCFIEVGLQLSIDDWLAMQFRCVQVNCNMVKYKYFRSKVHGIFFVDMGILFILLGMYNFGYILIMNTLDVMHCEKNLGKNILKTITRDKNTMKMK
jgi:hypothetical protein